MSLETYVEYFLSFPALLTLLVHALLHIFSIMLHDI